MLAGMTKLPYKDDPAALVRKAAAVRAITEEGLHPLDALDLLTSPTADLKALEARYPSLRRDLRK